MTFRELLSKGDGFKDFDVAKFYLAISLGLMENTTECWFKNKPILWSSNPLGDMLTNIITALVDESILERNEDMGVRWNDSYRVEGGYIVDIEKCTHKNFKELLTGYSSEPKFVDFDSAESDLACCLGIMEYSSACYINNKWVFWCRNHLGDMLGDIIFMMIDASILERTEIEDGDVRWNYNYKIE